MATPARIIRAKNFFVAAHDGQTYGTDLPYEYHLEKVVGVAREFLTPEILIWCDATEEEILIGCYGHDSVEDTCVSLKMIHALFGTAVERIVWSCTDAQLPPKDNGEKWTRHERKWGTSAYPGPMMKLSTTRAGLFVKLCDRIANIRASHAGDEKLSHRRNGKSYLHTYREEQQDFRTLRTPSPLDPMWDHLEALLA